MVPNNSYLGDVYAKTFLPAMERQLALAGKRLAGIINAQLVTERAR